MTDLPHSPAAERNAAPIAAVLREVLPATGTVLEVASGTGQHAVHWARAFPALTFQPTDRDRERVAVIAARVAEAGNKTANEAGVANILAPLALDASAPSWPVDAADAVLCANMIHISPWAATLGLLDGAAAILPPRAPLVLYGPYRREGTRTAPSNLAFDADLRRRDPAWGLRDLGAVAREASARGFGPPEVWELPANNIVVAFRRT